MRKGEGRNRRGKEGRRGEKGGEVGRGEYVLPNFSTVVNEMVAISIYHTYNIILKTIAWKLTLYMKMLVIDPFSGTLLLRS